MKIKVVSKRPEETSEFELREWHGMDEEHYGKTVQWNEKSYRFAAMDGDKMLGVVTGKHSAGVVYIEDLMVAKDSRGKGVGETLLNAAEDYGRKYKAHKTHLITGEGWKANDFYIKHGFKKIADLPDH